MQGHEIGIVMEYCGLGTLRTLLESRLPEGQILELMTQIMAGVKFLHENGIFHRDLKPENILLQHCSAFASKLRVRNDQPALVKISDLGIASFMSQKKATATETIESPQDNPGKQRRTSVVAKFWGGGSAQQDPTRTQTCSRFGTPAYMSPEALEGHSSFPSDMYALGVILAEMMTGESVCDSEIFSSAGAISQRVAAQKHYSKELLALAQALLAKRPEDRPSAKKAYSTLRDLREVHQIHRIFVWPAVILALVAVILIYHELVVKT